MPSLATVAPGGLQPGGEDWIELRYEGSWDPRSWSSLRERFIKAKEAARRPRVCSVVHGDEGDDLVVMPYGKSGGRDEWEWCIKWQGVTIWVKDCRKPGKEGDAGVRVELPSAFCMQHGGDGAVAVVDELLRSLGYRSWEGSANTLSRVDVCADVCGQSAEGLIELARTGYAVKRAKGDARPHEHFTPDGIAVVHSWAIGSGITMRIYDKARELREKPSPEKEAILRANRWGCDASMPLEHVVASRVEFQLRRKVLREMGVKTWKDWTEKRSQIIAWLSHEWFRLLEERPDRANRHQDRGRVHPEWARVVQCFAEWVGRANEPVQRPVRRLPDIKRLVMSGWGYITSICARSGLAVKSIEDAVSLVVQLGLDECERIGRTLADEVGRKRYDYVAATGAVVIDPGEIPY